MGYLVADGYDIIKYNPIESVPSSDKCKIYHYGGYMPIGNEEETLDEGAEEVGEEPIDG